MAFRFVGSSSTTAWLTRRIGLPFDAPKRPRRAKPVGSLDPSSSKPNAQSSLSSAKLGQPVATPSFFLLFASRSGLVIHLLARFQRTPQLPRQGGPDGLPTHPLLGSSLSSKLACAANSNVHKLVGLPKSLGLRRASAANARLLRSRRPDGWCAVRGSFLKRLP